MGPILSSEQIHNIAVDLLEMPRDDAFVRIGGMQVSDADRRRIIAEYNELYNAHQALPQEEIQAEVPEDRITVTERYEKTAEEERTAVPGMGEVSVSTTQENEPHRVSWWRYLVGAIGSIAIFMLLPDLIALIISFFSFFWSAFDASITMLFIPAISATLGIMLLSFMLQKGAKGWIICITIILSTMGGAVSINSFFFFNDIFYGIGYAISVIASIVTGVSQAREEGNNTELKTSNLVAITLTAIFCAIFAFALITLNALACNRHASAPAYWTENGAVYHLNPDCPTLANSGDIYSTSIDEAIFRGKERACEVCS